tara:strand:- start:109 stop:1386 length:1278 start_codon:yes stop_codon:yes gene_type:complete
MFFIYRSLTFLLFPFFITLIYFRTICKKEDPKRFKEKIFSNYFKSNRDFKKQLIWFHVASIGELKSILPLIDRINDLNKNINFLITSVTLSSSRLLESKLDIYSNITHRFFPLDTKSLSREFLDVWKPDLVCFVDSEIWPNFLFNIKEKKIPLVLINARITKKTCDRWKLLPGFSKQIFNSFDLCLASSIDSKNNLAQLGVKKLTFIGNLKFSTKIKKESLSVSNKKILNNFRVWCAASTHYDEEHIILKTHVEIKKKYNNIITIIIPRHINRVFYIEDLANKHSLTSQILNDDEKINSDKEIIIVNSFGVLLKYFNYCKNIFIGKSLVKKLASVAGQNPIEAAKSGCKIFHGPYVYNFQETYDYLKFYNISDQVNNHNDLSKKIMKNFLNSEKINDKNIHMLNKYGDKILEDTISNLNKFIKII